MSSTVLAPEAPPPKGGEPRAGLDLLPVVAALLTAVPVALVVGAASGAFEPVLLADAGPVVEFGLPVLRVLHDLAAALTVGLLLVAAFLTPEGRRSVRRATAARVAARAALVWPACAGAG
nr:cytochrome C oxidase assembly protein [Actinomycetota bacterium]